MSTADKAKNKAEKIAGQAKEKFGAATDDRAKRDEGRTDQTKSDLKDAGEKVKDAFRR
ncbi:CsbD family protein [Nocardia sp. NBC_00508]|uniref:CsbD family protein n=1 Tax=Nocardia sp. NBC_00508 TaxID=2975992 RepID=UPI002E822F30|nr:CsbD family protein [Nocardia sp. NBC_00508]WUD67870.1 CsbD family protein [Nocardia sp. NBC_00508]